MQFIDIDSPRIDFATMAGAFNVDSYTVRDLTELRTAFKKSITGAVKGNPSLIDIMLPKLIM